jgi:hypothetical protein
VPKAEEVKPEKWSSITILFDNGWYSVISGTYDGEDALGERWSGTGINIGFPNTRGYAQWYVIPDFLNIAILQGLLEEIRRHPYEGSDTHRKEIVTRLSGYYLE